MTQFLQPKREKKLSFKDYRDSYFKTSGMKIIVEENCNIQF